MSTKPVTPSTVITFGRDQWEAVTGLPLQTATEMVRLGMIRTLKIGRRRLFLHADLNAMFVKLADRGEHLKPRQEIAKRKAASEESLKRKSKPKPKTAAGEA